MAGVIVVTEKFLTAGLTANDAGTVLGGGKVGRCLSITVHVVANGVISAGKVKIESSHDPAYTGTWVLEGSEITLATDTCAVVQIVGPRLALRARVSTTLTGGGTVDAHVVGV